MLMGKCVVRGGRSLSAVSFVVEGVPRPGASVVLHAKPVQQCPIWQCNRICYDVNSLGRSIARKGHDRAIMGAWIGGVISSRHWLLNVEKTAPGIPARAQYCK